MNYKEYKQCKLMARIFNDKLVECQELERRVNALERENRLLKERLGYRRMVDSEYNKADSECLAIFHNRDAAVIVV